MSTERSPKGDCKTKEKRKALPPPLFILSLEVRALGGGKGGYWNGGTWKWNLLGWEKEGKDVRTVPGIILDFESRLGKEKVFIRM